MLLFLQLHFLVIHPVKQLHLIIFNNEYGAGLLSIINGTSFSVTTFFERNLQRKDSKETVWLPPNRDTIALQPLVSISSSSLSGEQNVLADASITGSPITTL